MSLETKAVALGCASAAGVSLSCELLGVPVTVVLAAILGATGILSFLPAMPIGRMVGTVTFCASVAIFGSGWISANWLVGYQALAALGVAALLQLLTPWLVENRGLIAERLLGLVGRKPADESKGDR